MRDVRNTEYISDIEALFPCADWKLKFTEGVGRGVSGTGVLTAVKLPKGVDCEVKFLHKILKQKPLKT